MTAFIGPSGCGKSTFIRCFNRMNDLIGRRASRATVLYHGADLYRARRRPVDVRRRHRHGLPEPNPFPKSIYDNVVYGPRVLSLKGIAGRACRAALRQAALWDEVKDPLDRTARSGILGRAAAAALHRARPGRRSRGDPHGRAGVGAGPDSTARIEDLMFELKRDYTIVIVTHNMQQAARVADVTAFFSVLMAEDGGARRGPTSRSTSDREDLHDAGRQADGRTT